jgi:hypothetical protein
MLHEFGSEQSTIDFAVVAAGDTKSIDGTE